MPIWPGAEVWWTIFADSLKTPYLYIVENTSKCAPMATMTSALGAVRLALVKPLRPSGPSASGCVVGNASGEYWSAATGMPVLSARLCIAGDDVFPHDAATDDEQRALGAGDAAAQAASSCAGSHTGGTVLR